MCKNQNYNKRSLIATLVVLAVCLVIVTGSTFSLFTSSTGVNIAVTAANVKLTATINQSSLELSSMGNKLEGNTFENGGKADFNANFTGLDLTYITPGDKATFTIDLVNTSNVNIQYRVTWKLTNAEGDTLANYLNVIVGDKKLELNAPTSEWTLWEPSNNAEDMTKSIKVSVEFPTNLWADETDEVRYANYRELMNNIANIEFAVEAVQGNGTYAFTAFVNSEAGLQNAINAGATHIVLTAPIELTSNLQIGASKQGKSGGAAETPVVDGILIDLNGHAITAAEGVDAGIANSEDVTFVNGTIAVDIANTGSVVAEKIHFVDCTVTSDGNDASFEKDDDTCTGDVVAAEYYDIDGVTYYWDSDSNKQTLYLVPSDYEGDTVVVAEGTYAIGNYAFAYNNNVKTVILAGSVRDLGRGFDESYVERVVLNEGLTTISSRAFRSTYALKEVVFSSTITSIADNAFQKSAIKEIVIPASVTTVGEAAFGASLIEKVTFEGNTNIEGYAFRGCTKLNTVILNGMDVNFVKSTLNGRNNCWFCNGESNNPNTSKITFYVKTNVIKERVLTAMGAERNNTPVNVEMTNKNGYDVDANGIAHVYTAEALKAALADGKDVVMACDITVAATAGGYGPVGITVDGQILDGNGHTLTVTGANSTWGCAIYVKGGNIQNIVVAGAMRGIFTGGTTADIYLNNVSFKNIIYTYNSDAGNKEYGVYATDCTFNGWTSFSNCHKEVVFTNCTFTKGSGYEFCRPYNAVVFNNCNFTEGYEFDTSYSNSIVLNDCTYGNTGITIANALSLGLFDNINNTTINGVAYVAGGYHVDANGVAYVSTADALKAAVANEKSIVMLNDITIPATKGGYSVAGLVVNGETIDGNGYTLTVTGAGSTWDCGIYITGGTVKNLVVKGAFRGIFTAGSSFDIYLNNVSFQNVVYTFSSDNGNGQNGVYATDCTFNGWTSYSNVYKEVVFTDCTFTEGSGYAFCRPYNATKFVGCTFTEGYKLDTSKVSGLVFDDCTYSDGLFYNGYNGAIFNGSVCVCTADELIAAINAAEDGDTITLSAGEYSLRFTNHITFNVDNLTIKGLGEVKLAISSSEAWYGRVQGSNVTFENIHFTSSVGATGKATYKNCIFDSWAICASSNKEETYYNNCTINGCLNTSTDFSSGNVYVKECEIAKAEYSGRMTVNFENCEIGEVIIWNSNTNFTNCKITTLNVDNVTSAKVTIK